jgi:hypothetical protein
VLFAASTMTGNKGGIHVIEADIAISFTSFQLLREKTDDPSCVECFVCEHCTSGTTPAMLQVDISIGAAYDGVYLLIGGPSCLWSGTTSSVSPCISGVPTTGLTLQIVNTTARIIVTYATCPFGVIVQCCDAFTKALSSAVVDCVDELAGTYDWDLTDSGCVSACVGSGSITVTVL